MSKKIVEAFKNILAEMEKDPTIEVELNKAEPEFKEIKQAEGKVKNNEPDWHKDNKKEAEKRVEEISKDEMCKDDKPHEAGSPREGSHDVVEEGSNIKEEVKMLHSQKDKEEFLRHLRSLKDKSNLRSQANQAVGMAKGELSKAREDEGKTKEEKVAARKDRHMGREFLENKGVHSPEKSSHWHKDGKKDQGVSYSGAKTRSGDAPSSKFDVDSGYEASKIIHKDKLKELKAQPKPNLPKSELSKDDQDPKSKSSIAQRMMANIGKVNAEIAAKKQSNQKPAEKLKIPSRGSRIPLKGPISHSSYNKLVDAGYRPVFANGTKPSVKIKKSEKDYLSLDKSEFLGKAREDEGKTKKEKQKARGERNWRSKDLETGGIFGIGAKTVGVPKNEWSLGHKSSGVHNPVRPKSGKSGSRDWDERFGGTMFGGKTKYSTRKARAKENLESLASAPKPNLPKAEMEKEEHKTGFLLTSKQAKIIPEGKKLAEESKAKDLDKGEKKSNDDYNMEAVERHSKNPKATFHYTKHKKPDWHSVEIKEGDRVVLGFGHHKVTPSINRAIELSKKPKAELDKGDLVDMKSKKVISTTPTTESAPRATKDLAGKVNWNNPNQAKAPKQDKPKIKTPKAPKAS